MDALSPTRRRSPHAVTVADLLCRYSTTPSVEARPPVVPPGEPVPVSALLRREGRARRALDRPLVPRGHSRPAPEPDADEPPRHHVRRATAAAGALFVVGAVFGTTALEDALLLPSPEADAGEPAGSAGIDGGVDRPGLLAGPDVARASTALPLADAPPVSGTDIGRAVLAPFTGPVARGASAPAVPGAAAAPGSGAVPGAGAVPGSPAAPGPVATPGTPVVPGPAVPPPGAEPSTPPGPGGPGTAGPTPPGSPTVTVPVPDLGTPEVEVPAVVLPSTPIGPVATPPVTVGEATVTAPDLGVTVDGEGVGVAITDTVADLPDAEVGPLDAGPVGLGTTSATLPAVTVEGTELLQVGPEPEVTVPGLEVSATEIETPPLHVGDAELDLPDVELPAVSTPEVPVVETVTGLLGGGSGLLG